MSQDNDGVDDRTQMGDAAVLSFDRLNPFSIAFWCNPDNTTSKIIVSKIQSMGNVVGYQINHELSAGDHVVRVTLRNACNDNIDRETSGAVLVAGSWRHIVVTYDGSSAASGVLVYASGSSVAMTTNNDSLTASIDNNIQFQVSGRAGANLTFAGLIAYVEVWNRAIVSQEVLQSKNYPGSITRGLVGFWPLWGTASPEPDYSGQKNNGTVTGAIKGTTEPPINGIFTVPRPELIHAF